MNEVEEVEIICRGILQKTMGRAHTISQIAPEAPSADYLSGHGAGHLEGQASVAALVLALLTGGSATQILEEARSAAAVDSAFPFDLHLDVDGANPPLEELPAEERQGGDSPPASR